MEMSRASTAVAKTWRSLRDACYQHSIGTMTGLLEYNDNVSASFEQTEDKR